MLKRVLAVFFLMLTFGGLENGPLSAAEPESKPTLGDVLKAWKARQEKVRSARFSWSGNVTRVLPNEEQQVLSAKRTCLLALNKDFVRWTSEGEDECQMKDGHTEWVDQRVTCVLGSKDTTLHFVMHEPIEQIDPSFAPSTGLIYLPEVDAGPSRNFHVDPIVMHFRALVPKLTNIEGNLSVTDRSGMVEGRRCWIIWEDGPRNTEYWVDPQRDFAIVRMRTFSFYERDMCLVDTEISYAEDPHVQWIPSSWRGSFFHKETAAVRESCEYRVTSYAINPAIESSTFEYRFPPGTKVADYRGPHVVQYLTRKDGEKRVITPGESAASYQDLLTTESGEATRLRSGDFAQRRTLWVLLGAIGLVLFVLAGFARQRRSRAR